MIVRVSLTQQVQEVGRHVSDMQSPGIVTLGKPRIQNTVYTKVARASQRLVLEIRMVDRTKILGSLHSGS